MGTRRAGTSHAAKYPGLPGLIIQNAKPAPVPSACMVDASDDASMERMVPQIESDPESARRAHARSQPGAL